MIPVARQPQPTTFDEDVRTPGLAWLRKRRGRGVRLSAPVPRKGQAGHRENFWQGGERWTRALEALADRYGGVCAYTALWIPPGTGSRTVDHFVPKARRPDLAYDWTNFRFAAGRVNGAKGDHTDVLDPCHEVELGWFRLEFALLSIYPNPMLPTDDLAHVRATIARLQLDGPAWRTERQRYWDRYLHHRDQGLAASAAREELARDAPHVYREAARQGLLDP